MVNKQITILKENINTATFFYWRDDLNQRSYHFFIIVEGYEDIAYLQTYSVGFKKNSLAIVHALGLAWAVKKVNLFRTVK